MSFRIWCLLGASGFLGLGCFQAPPLDNILFTCATDNVSCPPGFFCNNSLDVPECQFLNPIVDPLPGAGNGLTPFAERIISGNGIPGSIVEVEVNGVVKGEALVNENGDFFAKVALDDGENEIVLRAVIADVLNGEQVSDDVNVDRNGDPLTLEFDNNAPAFDDFSAQSGISFTINPNAEDRNAIGAAFADINRDGNLDLLFPQVDQFFFGNGNGTFNVGGNFPVDEAVVFGDIDGDGDDDVMGSNGNNPGNAELVFGTNVNGNINLIAQDLVDTRGVAFMDFNGDGNLDIAIVDRIGDDEVDAFLLFFAGDGNGGFQFTQEFVTINVNAAFVATGDVDGDGDTDLAVSDDVGGQLFLNNGAGNFAPLNQELFIFFNGNDGNRDRGLAFGDVDNDGLQELFAAGGNAPNGFIKFNAQGNAVDLNFGGNAIANPFGADDVAMADIDGDGDLDLFFSTDFQGDHVFLNDNGNFVGNATLLPQIGNPANQDGEAVVIVDVNNDGNVDFFVVDQSGVEPSRLYLNILEEPNILQANVTRNGAPAIGAKLLVREVDEASNGAIVGLREVNGGRGNGSQDPGRLYFGGILASRLYQIELIVPGCNGGNAIVVEEAFRAFDFAADPKDRILDIDIGDFGCN